MFLTDKIPAITMIKIGLKMFPANINHPVRTGQTLNNSRHGEPGLILWRDPVCRTVPQENNFRPQIKEHIQELDLGRDIKRTSKQGLATRHQGTKNNSFDQKSFHRLKLIVNKWNIFGYPGIHNHKGHP